MGLLVSLSLAMIPIITAAGIDALEKQAAVSWLALLVGALLVTALVQYFANWAVRRAINLVVADVISQLRKDAMKAAVERDMAFYDETKSGKVLSRITSDTEEIGQVLLLSSDILSQIVEAALLIGVLLSRDAVLTLIMLAAMPVIVGVALLFRRLARDVTRQGSRAMAAVNDNIQESVTGISVAKNFRDDLRRVRGDQRAVVPH
jgi:ATP-binding cassette subfamily B protein